MGEAISTTSQDLVLCTEVIRKCLEHYAGIIVEPPGYARVKHIRYFHFVKKTKGLLNPCIFRDFSCNSCHFIK
jgi:hypothetical protein